MEWEDNEAAPPADGFGWIGVVGPEEEDEAAREEREDCLPMEKERFGVWFTREVTWRRSFEGNCVIM